MIAEDIEMEEELEIDELEEKEGICESSYENEQSMDENDKNLTMNWKKKMILDLGPLSEEVRIISQKDFRFSRVFRRSQDQQKT